MDEAIRATVGDAFPNRSVTAVEPTDGSANPGNRTVRIAFEEGGRAYLKLAVDGSGERMARAATAMSFAGDRTGVRAPGVLAADPDGSRPYLATAQLAGEAVGEVWWTASTSERATLLRGVGRTLAALHEPSLDEPGRIVGGGSDGLEIEPVAWPDLLTDETGIDDVPDRFSGVPERIQRALDDRQNSIELDGDDGPNPALLHADVRDENCVRRWDGGEGQSPVEIGLLDWEQAIVGDPVFDLCRAEQRFVGRGDVPDRAVLRDALVEGYRDRAGRLPGDVEERRRIYRVCTFRSTIEGFDEWAPAVDEPTDELATWVREELGRRLDRL